MSWLGILMITIFMVSFVAGALARGRTTRLLTPEQANQVAATLAMSRVSWLFLQLYCAIGLGLFFIFHVPLPSLTLFVLAGAGAGIWSHLSVIRKLRALNLPAAYIPTFTRERILAASPWLALILFMMYDVVRSWL